MTPRSNHGPSDHGTGDDTVFALLSNKRRRYIIRYFLDLDDGIAEPDDLVEHILTHDPGSTPEDREAIAIQLHHRHLPILAEHDVVDYDRNGRIRYRGDDRLETYFGHVSDHGLD